MMKKKGLLGSALATLCWGGVLISALTLVGCHEGDHEYDNGTVTKAATCTEAGEMTYTCTVDGCTDSYIEVIPATGHSYVTTTKEATCLEDGYTESVCSVCGDKQTKTLAATGHSVTYSAPKDATCTEEGSTGYYYCSGCDKYFADEGCTSEMLKSDAVIELAGHNITYTAEKAATCKEEGNVAYYSCKTCGKYFADEQCTTELSAHDIMTEKTEHSLTVSNYKAPTCTEEGHYTYYYCKVCGNHYSDAAGTAPVSQGWGSIEKISHSYSDGVCTMCGDKNTTASYSETGPKYVLSSDGTYYSVEGMYTKSSTTVTILSTYNNKPVTAISGDAFNGCDSLVTIYIPNSVTVVGGDVFADCAALENISFSGTKDEWADVVEDNDVDIPAGIISYFNGTAVGSAHTHTLQQTVEVVAMCESSGVASYECVNCTTDIDDAVLSALEHEYDNDCDTTCNREGCGYVRAVTHTPEEDDGDCSTAVTCSVCGEILTAAKAHDYECTSETTVSCTAAASKTYACKNDGCTQTYTEEIGSATGHSVSGATTVKETLVSGTTCEYIVTVSCTTCGEEVDLDEHLFKHTYKAAVTTEATCQTEGLMTYTCQVCGAVDTEAIAVNTETGHSWSDTPTSTDGSKKTYSCTREGCTATKTVIDASTETSAAVDTEDLADNSVQLKDAEIKLDTDTINGLSGTEDLTISATTLTDDEKPTLTEEQAEQIGDNPIYNFTMTQGSDTVSSFNGKVTVTLPYTLGADEDADSIAVWFINSKGEVESIKATYCNGYVTFETDHFSYYTVTRLTPAERCALYGHNYTYRTVDVSCTSDGYVFCACRRCGGTESKDVVKATGHNYQVTATESASCAVAGYTEYTCANCGDAYKTQTAALGHSYDEGVETTAAACAQDGVTTYTCSVCGDSYTESISALGHDWQVETETAATCTEKGETVYACSVCGATKTEQSIYFGHDWQVSDEKASTCTEQGYTKYTCSNCNEEKSESAKKLSHNYVDGVCSVCGAAQPTDCDHQTLTESTINLADYGACEGTLYIAVCNCGQVVYFVNFKSNCSWKQTSNDDGSMSLDCTVCGLHVDCVNGYEEDSCNYIYTYTYAFSINGTAITTCIRQSTYSHHVYEYTYVLSGTNCTDGVTVTETCTVCGETDTYTIYYHNRGIKTATYDLSEYGVTGTITLYQCPCGTDKKLTWDIDSEYSSSSRSNTDDDGVYHYVRTIVSAGTDGNLIIVEDEYTITYAAQCKYVRYTAYSVTYNGTEVLSYLAQTTNDDHNFVYTFTLDGDDCYDGYTANGVCTVCGLTDTASGSYHNTYPVKIYDLSSYGVNGTITVEECACGEYKYLDRDISGNYNYDHESYTDDDGIYHTVHTYTYTGADGNLVIAEDYYTVTNKAQCKEIDYTKYTVTYGETEIVSCLGQSVSESHSYEYTFELDGDDCTDGYTVTYTCSVCGDTYTSERSGHHTYAVKTYDLSEYGVTGTITLSECPCGEEKSFSRSISSDYDYDYESYTDDDGVYHRVYTYTYTGTDGNLVLTEDRYSVTVKADCMEYDYYVYTVTYGEKDIIKNYITYNSWTSHSYEYTFELNGDDCEDGYTVTHTCSVCGETYTYTGTNHETYAVKTYDLSEYGSACGGTITFYECACKQQSYMGYSVNYYTTTNTDKDDDGHTVYVKVRTCNDCDLEWQTSYYTVRDSSTCTATTYYTETISVGATAVDSFTRIEVNTSHDYAESGAFLTDSQDCSDGIVITYKCKDCGYTYTDIEYYHYTFETARYDLSEYGSVCGGYAVEYECLCGNRHNLEFEDLLCEMEYSGNSVYTCAVTDPACGFTYRYIYSYKKADDECVKYQYETYQFGYDAETDTCQKEITFKTGYYDIAHTYTSEDVTVTNNGVEYSGTKTTCSVCGSYYINFTKYGTGDYSSWSTSLRKETYNATKDSDGTVTYWSKYEYTYAFDSDCNRTTVYTNSDGKSTTSTESYHYERSTSKTTVSATCTQYGSKVYTYYCPICGSTLRTNTSSISPDAHRWLKLEDGRYLCTECGLENANGASGDIVMEDLTSSYGGDEKYVVGYYNKGSVKFTYYVSLILNTPDADGNDEVILDDITFTEMTASTDGVTAIAFSKADVLAAATAAGYTEDEYNVRFAFVPANAGGSYDYAITFTDAVTEVSSAGVYVTDKIAAGETFTYTITPTETAVWTMTSKNGYESYGTLLNSDNATITSGYMYSGFGYSISYTLEAGKTYYLQVKFYSSSSSGYIPVEFTTADAS